MPSQVTSDKVNYVLEGTRGSLGSGIDETTTTTTESGISDRMAQLGEFSIKEFTP